jgi:hypothetical protein
MKNVRGFSDPSSCLQRLMFGINSRKRNDINDLQFLCASACCIYDCRLLVCCNECM